MAATISFRDFMRIDLKVGRILKAERMEGTKKLLKLEVDLAKEKRQLVAGIGEYYNADELTGKEIVVVTNLEPKRIRGVLSQGMLLAAVLEGDMPVIIKPDRDVPPGTPVS